jgi:hypothetical protein
MMLAEEIGGFLILGGLLIGGIISAILALVALFPAARGNRSLAIKLILPAICVVLLSICWIGSGFIQVGFHDEHFRVADALHMWLCVAALPLVTGFIAAFVLWTKGN